MTRILNTLIADDSREDRILLIEILKLIEL